MIIIKVVTIYILLTVVAVGCGGSDWAKSLFIPLFLLNYISLDDGEGHHYNSDGCITKREVIVVVLQVTMVLVLVLQ